MSESRKSNCMRSSLMEKKNLVFVILHYLAVNETISCIDSIRKFIDDNYKIIVVDNASPNHSGEELKRLYDESTDVVVLLSEDNLGFAKGNNLGIKYVRQHYDFEFCIVCNNDTLLLENDLYKKIKETYDDTGFAVLGPMILTADGRANINPTGTEIPTVASTDKLIKEERGRLRAEKYAFLKVLGKIKNKLSKRQERRIGSETKKEYITLQQNVELHGSFLVFSQRYFEHFEGFYEGTFLYNEERILYLLAERAGLLMVYQPSIKVFHKEDAATDMLVETSRKKSIFLLQNSLESLKILRSLLEEDKQETNHSC